MYQTLKLDRSDSILTLVIDRAAKLNALSSLVLRELAHLFTELRRERGSVRGMILTGAGDRAFVAGADIAEMATMSSDEGAAFGRLGQEVTERLEALPFPVIACVHGYALGGGCELAMACDYIYATENAQLGQPEVNLGLIPGFGGCVRLIRLVGPGRAKELIYTGRSIGAYEARAIGLVNRVFASRAEMMRAAMDSIAEVATRSPVAVDICKQVLSALPGRTTAQQLAAEAEGFWHAFASDDKREGVAAFLAKRQPRF